MAAIALTAPKHIITKPILLIPHPHDTNDALKSAAMKACSAPMNIVMGRISSWYGLKRCLRVTISSVRPDSPVALPALFLLYLLRESTPKTTQRQAITIHARYIPAIN
uniref:Uncharacterized protein n=1 Tax=Photinus pyralis TaxID=7054 RepID=A0A1Y1NB87_PHOPY